MKIFIAAIFSLLLPSVLLAQNCSGYYYMSNSTVEIAVYDGKLKDNGKIVYNNSGVKKSGSSTSANFVSEVFDKKGKSISKGSGTYKCENGALYLDARMSIPNEQAGAYKDMDVKAEESFIEYPASLSLNQSLKDGHLKMKMYKKDELYATMTFDATERKVVAKESITTAAGTWDCWKITSNSKFRMEVAGIGIPVKFETVEWFSPGFGIVKTETYKGNKLMGSTAIASYTK